MDRLRKLITCALTVMLMAAAFFVVFDTAGSSAYADTDRGYTVIIYYNGDHFTTIRGGGSIKASDLIEMAGGTGETATSVEQQNFISGNEPFTVSDDDSDKVITASKPFIADYTANRRYIRINTTNGTTEGYYTFVVHCVMDDPQTWDELEAWVEQGYYLGDATDVNLTLSTDITCDEPAGYYNHMEVLKGSVTIDLNGHTIDRKLESSTGYGHIFRVYSGASLTIHDSAGGGMITGAYTTGGDPGAIFVNSGATFFMDGGSISNNNSSDGNGGAIYTYGTTTLSGDITISGNSTTYGGGIYTGGYTTIGKGVVIRNNTASDSGGGIYYNANANGSLTISGATIADNSAGYGGGIRGGGDITINEGTVIENNTATTDYGGGICFEGGSSSTLKISGATIRNNTSEKKGGGVYTNYKTNVIIEDCTITGNKVNCDEDSFYGGGGVYLYADSGQSDWNGTNAAAVSGTNDISGNTANGKASDLVVGRGYSQYWGKAPMWLISGALGEGTDIGVTTNATYYPYFKEPYVFTSGYADNNTEDPWVYFTSDLTDYIVLWNDGKTEAVLGKGVIVTYDANGGEGEMTEDHFALNSEGEAQAEVPESSFTRENYEFTGWNTKADGSGTAYAAGDTAKLTENTVLYAQWKKTDSGSGSKTTSTTKPVLVAKAIAKGKKKGVISWNNVKADRYVVYLCKCNYGTKKYKFKKVKTLSGKKLKYTTKKLKKNRCYKFKVVAQKKVNGKYKTIATSYAGHFCTANVRGSLTNPKSMKLNKTKVTLKNGGTVKLSAKVTKVKKSKNLATTHTKLLRYRSNDPSVASVDKNGKVTAKKAGTATIYVQTINGMWKTCKVTVK